jgi:membrane protein
VNRVGFKRGAREVVVEATRGAARHRIDTLAAALAFNVLLALAPLLIVAVAVLGIVLGHADARGEVIGAVRIGLGSPGAAMMADWLDAAQAASATATAVGLVLFLLGATRLVAQVATGLDVINETPRGPERSIIGDLRHWLLARLRGAGITVGLVLWLAVSLAGSQAIAALWPAWAGGILRLARDAIAFTSLAAALTVVYRLAPHQRLAWREVIIGAVISAVLLWFGTWLLSLWFGVVKVGASYGAAGSVVAVLTWLYLSSLVFLYGAELGVAVSRRRWIWRLRRRRGMASNPAGHPSNTM